jgi:starvation-inducible DNA-binding protein
MEHAVVDELRKLLADTYIMSMKYQNFHWHVSGPLFTQYHAFFEDHYTALGSSIDAIAERIVMLGSSAPASFSELQQFSRLEETASADKVPVNIMLNDLSNDHQNLLKTLQSLINIVEQDEATSSLLADEIGQHEKMLWMVRASNQKG